MNTSKFLRLIAPLRPLLYYSNPLRRLTRAALADTATFFFPIAFSDEKQNRDARPILSEMHRLLTSEESDLEEVLTTINELLNHLSVTESQIREFQSPANTPEFLTGLFAALMELKTFYKKSISVSSPDNLIRFIELAFNVETQFRVLDGLLWAGSQLSVPPDQDRLDLIFDLPATLSNSADYLAFFDTLTKGIGEALRIDPSEAAVFATRLESGSIDLQISGDQIIITVLTLLLTECIKQYSHTGRINHINITADIVAKSTTVLQYLKTEGHDVGYIQQIIHNIAQANASRLTALVENTKGSGVFF